MKFLNIFAPSKQRYVRANEKPFVTKELRKAFMKNKYIKVKAEASLIAYKKHRTFCKYLVLKSKKKYYENLKPSSFCDGRKFWKVVKSLFSDKVIKNDNITQMESDKIISDPTDIANEFSSLFSSAVSTSEIKDLYPMISNVCNDPVLSAIDRFKNHTSILRFGALYPSP